MPVLIKNVLHKKLRCIIEMDNKFMYYLTYGHINKEENQ